jgi:hypothetical protein
MAMHAAGPESVKLSLRTCHSMVLDGVGEVTTVVVMVFVVVVVVVTLAPSIAYSSAEIDAKAIVRIVKIATIALSRCMP